MNVNLWFARNEENEIIGVLKSSNDNIYTCPICTSKVIPKALESTKITPHFAHVVKEKCSNESMLHFWFKHKFIERGDTFTIVADEEYAFTCKDFKTEVTFSLESGTYRPDIVIETECGNEIVFEMANTNKKKVQDYIDRWIELDKIVVEVDIPSLTNESDIAEFKALYYNGKCFNFNKREIKKFNKLKEMKDKLYETTKDLEVIKSIDWLWREVVNYHKNKENIEFLYSCYKILDSEQKSIVSDALYNVHEISLESDYKEYIQKKLILAVSKKINITEISKTFTNINNLLNSYSNGFYLEEYVSRDRLFVKYEKDFNESVNEICDFLYKVESNDSFLFYMKLKYDDNLNAFISDINEKSNYSITFYEEFNHYREKEVNVLMVKRKGKYYDHVLHLLDEDSFSCDIDDIKRKVQGFLNILDRIYVAERKHKTISRYINELRFFSAFEMVYNYDCAIISEYDNYIALGVIDKYNSKNNIYLVVWGYKIYLIKDTSSFEKADIQHQFKLLEGASFIDLKKVKMNKNIITGMINDVLNNLKKINIDSCKNCFSTITLSKNEYKWFLEKDFNLPKLCDACRKERKKERLNG